MTSQYALVHVNAAELEPDLENTGPSPQQQPHNSTHSSHIHRICSNHIGYVGTTTVGVSAVPLSVPGVCCDTVAAGACCSSQWVPVPEPCFIRFCNEGPEKSRDEIGVAVAGSCCSFTSGVSFPTTPVPCAVSSMVDGN